MALALVACAHREAPPVAESKVVKKSGAARSAAPSPTLAATGQQYTVEKGDTLYSIAFRHGLDFRTLAAVNGIREPYTIYPGQVLTIKSRGQPLPLKATRPPAPSAAPPPRPADVTTETPARQETAVAARPAAKPEPAPAAKKPESVAPASAPTVSPPAKPVEVPAVVQGPVPTRFVGGGHWQWPVHGKLLSVYNRAGVGPKGIALAGNVGDSVRAARDGRVVYTGSSLVGYGQLVIVKHDDVYLSAYAHNSRVLVKEGETVKAGQKIAEMGSTGTDRTKLHFEVRRNGEPVDPLSVLPLL